MRLFAGVPPVRTMVFAAIAALFAVLQIQHSLDQGPLAFPVTYDDSSYYWDGLQRLHRAYDVGLRALVQDYVQRAPHSTWSTAMALLGFATFGPVDWAPIAANGLVLVLAAGAIAYATRRLSAMAALAVLVAALTWRYAGHLAMESRPDMVWGLALACFAALGSRLAITEWSRGERWTAAALLAVALLAKLTTFPVTIAVTGTVIAAVAIVRRRRLGTSWWQSARPFAWTLLVSVLIVLPVYALSAAEALRYVYDNVFGARASTWELPLSASEHLLYHLTGIGGRAMMGAWLALWTATLVVCAVIARRLPDRSVLLPAVPFAAAFAVGFLAVTLPAHKSPHIGAVVPAFFLVSWIALAVFAARELARRGVSPTAVTIALWAFAVVGIAQFQWHATVRLGPNMPERHKEAEARRQTVERLLSDLESAGAIQGTVFVTGSTPYINAMMLRYYAEKRRHPAPQFNDDIFISDPEAMKRNVAAADAVIAFSEDNGDLTRWLPSGTVEMQKHAAQALAADQAELREFRYPSPAGGDARLYVRRGPFDNVIAKSGMGALEGPHPQWKLPIVRWGYGPESTLAAASAKDAPMRLRVEAQSPFADQVVGVYVDGRKAGEMRFAAKDVAQTFEVLLGPLARSSVISLKYEQWAKPTPADPRAMAVLFRKLQLY